MRKHIKETMDKLFEIANEVENLNEGFDGEDVETDYFLKLVIKRAQAKLNPPKPKEEKPANKYSKRRKECKFCGEGDLSWKSIEGKWKLIDEFGVAHRCDPSKKKIHQAKEKIGYVSGYGRRAS